VYEDEILPNTLWKCITFCLTLTILALLADPQH